ncbi:MAG: transporter substrate-binding domain-containing protein [Bacteriovoracaceae bacterium]|nr:transporter substrate-binding domain-containing protein [Bacteriovoracaceae bacterium]
MTIKFFSLRYLILFSIVQFLWAATAYGATIKYALPNWPPMGYVEQNKLKGMIAEIVKEVFEGELKIKVIPDVNPWNRAQRQVELGRADFMVSALTDLRLGYAIASELPFVEMSLHIFSMSTHPKSNLISKVKSAQDLIDNNLTSVTNRGNGWHKKNIENKGVKTHLVSDENDAILFLKHKQADVMIDTLVATNKVIKEQGLTDIVVANKKKFELVKFYLMVSKKSKYSSLMPKINKAFYKLKKSGVIRKIISRYEGPL